MLSNMCTIILLSWGTNLEKKFTSKSLQRLLLYRSPAHNGRC